MENNELIGELRAEIFALSEMGWTFEDIVELFGANGVVVSKESLTEIYCEEKRWRVEAEFDLMVRRGEPLAIKARLECSDPEISRMRKRLINILVEKSPPNNTGV